jgi:inhibitor of KinA sporulation pathway (predicted exonuclease)
MDAVFNGMGKARSLNKAVEKELGEFKGRPHSGEDDAFNLGSLLRHMRKQYERAQMVSA